MIRTAYTTTATHAYTYGSRTAVYRLLPYAVGFCVHLWLLHAAHLLAVAYALLVVAFTARTVVRSACTTHTPLPVRHLLALVTAATGYTYILRLHRVLVAGSLHAVAVLQLPARTRFRRPFGSLVGYAYVTARRAHRCTFPYVLYWLHGCGCTYVHALLHHLPVACHIAITTPLVLQFYRSYLRLVVPVTFAFLHLPAVGSRAFPRSPAGSAYTGCYVWVRRFTRVLYIYITLVYIRSCHRTFTVTFAVGLPLDCAGRLYTTATLRWFFYTGWFWFCRLLHLYTPFIHTLPYRFPVLRTCRFAVVWILRLYVASYRIHTPRGCGCLPATTAVTVLQPGWLIHTLPAVHTFYRAATFCGYTHYMLVTGYGSAVTFGSHLPLPLPRFLPFVTVGYCPTHHVHILPHIAVRVRLRTLVGWITFCHSWFGWLRYVAHYARFVPVSAVQLPRRITGLPHLPVLVLPVATCRSTRFCSSVPRICWFTYRCAFTRVVLRFCRSLCRVRFCYRCGSILYIPPAGSYYTTHAVRSPLVRCTLRCCHTRLQFGYTFGCGYAVVQDSRTPRFTAHAFTHAGYRTVTHCYARLRLPLRSHTGCRHSLVHTRIYNLRFYVCARARLLHTFATHALRLLRLLPHYLPAPFTFSLPPHVLDCGLVHWLVHHCFYLCILRHHGCVYCGSTVHAVTVYGYWLRFAVASYTRLVGSFLTAVPGYRSGCARVYYTLHVTRLPAVWLRALPDTPAVPCGCTAMRLLRTAVHAAHTCGLHARHTRTVLPRTAVRTFCVPLPHTCHTLRFYACRTTPYTTHTLLRVRFGLRRLPHAAFCRTRASRLRLTRFLFAVHYLRLGCWFHRLLHHQVRGYVHVPPALYRHTLPIIPGSVYRATLRSLRSYLVRHLYHDFRAWLLLRSSRGSRAILDTVVIPRSTRLRCRIPFGYYATLLPGSAVYTHTLPAALVWLLLVAYGYYTAVLAVTWFAIYVPYHHTVRILRCCGSTYLQFTTAVPGYARGSLHALRYTFTFGCYVGLVL